MAPVDNTENLALPYIMASQSQKHVTHNEALRALDALVQLAVADKDLGTPPESPAFGARYIVGPSPTGAWAGRANHIAAWQDGAWAFYAPVAGWLAWVHDESRLYLYGGGGWTEAPGSGGAGLVPKGAWNDTATYNIGDLVEHGGHAFLSNADSNVDNEPDAVTPGSTAYWTHFSVVTGGGGGGGGEVNPVPLVGINDTADTTNRLAVSSPASLFSHEGDDHRLKINKAAAGDTASVLFQTDFVGHAEFGLAGDNDWHVKVSPDGTTWHEALVVNRATGAVSFPNTPGGGGGGSGRELLVANRTYYVNASTGDDGNTGLSPGTAFATIQRAIDAAASLDIGVYDVVINVADGTYAPIALKRCVGAGKIYITGNTAAPANCHITSNEANARLVDASNVGGYANPVTEYVIQGLKLSSTGSGTSYGLFIEGAGLITFGALDFGAISIHMRASSGGAIQTIPSADGNYAVSGGGTRHAYAQQGGQINTFNRTVTITGTPNFTVAWAMAERQGGLTISGMTFNGSATGTRYRAQFLGLIYTNGAANNYLPGNSAGTADGATGGYYV